MKRCSTNGVFRDRAPINPGGQACAQVAWQLSEPRRPSKSDAAEAPRPAELRCLWAGGVSNPESTLSPLTTRPEPQGSRCSIAAILVTIYEGRIVVVLPYRAWRRTVNKRKMPAGSFTKPLLIEVGVVSALDRALEGGLKFKVWLGLLSWQTRLCWITRLTPKLNSRTASAIPHCLLQTA